MEHNTGFIVVIAYPETVVRTANGELMSKIWPFFGVGGQQKVRAGHAALLLVSKKTNKVNYFDFGRYITSNTFGRVRSEETDNELSIPFAAVHNSKQIENLEEILLFLENHPEKTHGDGRMIVAVNHEINYKAALSFILELQGQIEVPYGAFKKKASNCARFVTDTLIASTTNKKIRKKLKNTYVVTPSPVGNVLKGKSENNECLEVFKQQIKSYPHKTVFQEHKRCLFSTVSQELNEVGTVKPDLKSFASKNGQWLGGIGSGAWFELYKDSSDAKVYKIVRRNAKGIVDLEDVFILKNGDFSIHKPYFFQFGSNCRQCILLQNKKKYLFERIKYLEI